MQNYLRKLIAEGESQHLDFKYCVSDSYKIARIPAHKTEEIIANLILFKVLIMNASEKGFTYELNEEVGG